MKILITGGSGMVGKNIINHEGMKKHELIYPSRLELDLTNFDEVKTYLMKERPDFIIHCAGLVGGIQANMKQPVEFLIENLDMGRNVVIAASEVGVKKLISFGSNCMYPKDIESGLSEEMILKGELESTNEGYALAKIVTAKLCSIISKKFEQLDYKVVIPCSLFGKWDKFSPKNSHFIPAIIKKLVEAKESNLESVEIWGDGEARRELMYTEDLADFIIFAIDNFSEMPVILNVGPGVDYSINEYYKKVSKVVGYEGEFHHNLDKPVGMRKKLLQVDKMKNFGWSPSFDLEEGLKRTSSFYLENKASFQD